MPATYKRPGVYLEESLLVTPAEVSATTTVAAFVGAAPMGPPNRPILVDSWSTYTNYFGGFSNIVPPSADSIDTNVLSYLPYAVYTFFQNGGRYAWVVRAAGAGTGLNGAVAKVTVQGGPAPNAAAFDIEAVSVGLWGNSLQYRLEIQKIEDRVDPAADVSVFSVRIRMRNSLGDYETIETFSGLTTTGDIPGTRRVDAAINDPLLGSRYVRVRNLDIGRTLPVEELTGISLATGEDPGIPNSTQLGTAAKTLSQIEGPMTVNIAGYLADASKVDTSSASFVSGTINPLTDFPDRQDILFVNDGCRPTYQGESNSDYIADMEDALLANPDDSYTAAYTPWIIIPHPTQPGSTVAVPPGGSVIGTMARIDTGIGVWRAPAGVIAGLNNAIGVQARFTDGELGSLNNENINVIRPVVGSGICIMGARTRRDFGPDRYINARRTLIYLKETLRRNTQWAVFENNDERLWSALRITADSILRPVWEQGGLRGSTAREAYYIRCDEQLNTPQVIAQGEVRMEVGVALEYPAEFVIIRVTQIATLDFAGIGGTPL